MKPGNGAGHESRAAAELAALVGSRICHDLINPLGAIGNGVELMELSGAPGGPELSLVADSVAAANARVRFFRLAFGRAAPGAEIARAEVADLLAAAARGGRSSYFWAVEGALPRAEIRAVLLALLCIETATPRGAEVQIRREGGRWRLVAEAATIDPAPALWTPLLARQVPDGLTPAQVQFGILPPTLHDLGFGIEMDVGRSRMIVTLGPD
ncbi:histidine phosphotransferase family protein [Wenxinia saemankumensis]|uniref:Histidine phosphotransferase ChpT n=1 Tax=Wenxinia saemankumensis TaxID=1447782 RepID=A0A1M6HIY5_9RHOB|nr:histidine phosphotransferase family protein [Wenxinia saemankumensis]SHJ22148.1 histidine phosphotransferase ChpT [Wenxinia saemankumensis]